MITRKFIPFRGLMAFAWFHFIWPTVLGTIVVLLYGYAGWKWVAIPWQPVTVIGTAVAFYLGFKNSQSYDRMWEARKIWGAIVNSSRSWGAMVNSFIYNPSLNSEEIFHRKQRLIYRHIAWLYTLRDQLLVPTQWEHVSLSKNFGEINRVRRDLYGIGLFEGFLSEKQSKKYFFDKANWENTSNHATQIIGIQTQDLMNLKIEGTLDLFYQLRLQETLNEFYVQQGQAERIKKFPFPRQFANSSFLLNTIFIFLLPLGLVSEFAKIGSYGIWLMVPFSALVSWIYIIMELVGDYSENPFEGLMLDVPMLSICRSIEIDLLQVIGDTDIPPAISAKQNILM